MLIRVPRSDLRFDTYRASGAGGQHRNKTDSAVRVTHVPTGVVAYCEDERSQAINKRVALDKLRGKLVAHYKEPLQRARAEAGAANKAAAVRGSHIRTYRFAGQRMVVDAETGVKTSDIDAVMDGDIDRFIQARLLKSGGEHGKHKKQR